MIILIFGGGLDIICVSRGCSFMTFSMWSPLHWIFISSPFIFAAALVLFTRSLHRREKFATGVIFSLTAIVILLLRNGEILYYHNWVIDAEVIPLQICHFANFVLLAAFLRDSKMLFSLAYCLNLPAALCAIVFANSLENYDTILTFRAQAFLWGHTIIAGLAIWALMNGFVRISRRTFAKTLAAVCGLYMGSLAINNFFRHFFGLKANYFYSMRPERGTPLEFFYSLSPVIKIGWFAVNPLYLLATITAGLVVTTLFYLVYMLVMRVFKTRFERTTR